MVSRNGQHRLRGCPTRASDSVRRGSGRAQSCVRRWRRMAVSGVRNGFRRKPLTLAERGSIECLNGCSEASVLDALDVSAAHVPAETDRTPYPTTGTHTGTHRNRPPDTPSVSADVPVVPVETTRKRINALGADQRAVERALSTLGIDAPLGQAFPCVLGPMASDSAEARVERDPVSGLFVYARSSASDFLRLTLAEVRAAVAYGALKALTRSEAAVWYRRFFFDAGVLRPVVVPLPKLPRNAAIPLHKLRLGFALLVGLRWLTHGGQPAMFGRYFVMAWCGVTQQQAKAGVHELRRLNVIRHVDTCQRTYVYLPGKVAPDNAGRTP
jgi:hypothetical protein